MSSLVNPASLLSVSSAPSKLPCVVILGVGTQSTDSIRHFQTFSKKKIGGPLGHVTTIVMDTTALSAQDGVDTLPEDDFQNLAEQPGLPTKFRRAHDDPIVKSWMAPELTMLSPGNGVGGYSQGARFEAEQKMPVVLNWLHRRFERLSPDRLVRFAERASQHPRVRAWKAVIEATGAIQTYVVASSTGGTVGFMPRAVMLLKYVFYKLGIESNYTLLLTPPARSPVKDGPANRRHCNSFALSQQLVDIESGKKITWPVGGLVLEHSGKMFEATYVLNEPQLGRLAEHARGNGELFVELAGPLGKRLSERSVDMLGPSRETGSHGQRKMFSRLHHAKAYATAIDEPQRIAELVIAADVMESRSIDAAGQVAQALDAVGLSSKLATDSNIVFHPSSPPEDLQDVDWYVSHVEAAFETEGKARVDKEKTSLAQIVTNAHAAIGRQVRAVTEAGGPTPGRELLRQALAAFEKCHAEAMSQEAHCRRAGAAKPQGEGLSQRLAALANRQTHVSRGQLANELVKLLQGAIVGLRSQLVRFDQICDTFEGLRVEMDQKRIDVKLIRQHDHAILNRTAIEELAKPAGQSAAAAIRKASYAEIGASSFDPGRFGARVRASVAKAAQAFAKLANVAEAIRHSRDAGRGALQAAIESAQPAAKLDPLWDPRTHATLEALTSAPNDHLVNELMQASGRKSLSAETSETNFITIIAVDFCIEPAAFDFVREGLEAFLVRTDPVSPFPEQHYEPKEDVWLPLRSEWFAHLAIATHLALHDPRIQFDAHARWLFEGRPIGADLVSATATLLNREGRPEFLPSFEDLGAQTKALLEGCQEGPVEMLRQIEKKLTAEMVKATAAAKFVLNCELAVAHKLCRVYEDELAVAAHHFETWGKPNGQINHNRLERIGGGNGQVAH